MGIEPTSQAWEARILPMNYTRRRLFIIADSDGKSKGNLTDISCKKARDISLAFLGATQVSLSTCFICFRLPIFALRRSSSDITASKGIPFFTIITIKW